MLFIFRYKSISGSPHFADDAPPAPTSNATNVLDVETRITGLRSALELRRNRALTPYKVDAWQFFLQGSNLLVKYPNLILSLRKGFDAGIPPIYLTYTPPNSPTLLQHPQAYHEMVANELRKGRYIGPCTRLEVEALIGPFQSSPLSWVPKPGKPGKYRAVQTSPFPAYPPPPSRQLTLPSMQICTHARGALLTQSAPLFMASHPVLRRLSAMLLKLTVPSPSSLTNGPVLSSNYSTRTSSPSTYATTLVSPQPEGFMARLVMQPLTFFAPKGLVPSQNGSTTTSSFASQRSTAPHTTCSVNVGMASSCKTEAAINQAAAYGTKVRACLTTPLPSLMKTQLVPSQTIPPCPIMRESTQSLHTAMLTLTTSPDNSAFPGNHQRPSPFRRRCLSWALTGTFRIVRWPSPRTKGPSTGKPSRIGFKIPPITWRRRRSYLVSYYTPARFSQLAGPTLPIWKASWLPLVRTPLFPIMHHVTPQTILLGGTTFSTPPDSRDPSQVPPASPTDMPSQTPAQVLASALLLATGGGRGVSSQDGRQRAEISDGLKPLASSFLLALSAPPVNQASTSGSLETTRELSKVGGRAEAETGRPTRFSGASMTSQILTSAFLSHAM